MMSSSFFVFYMVVNANGHISLKKIDWDLIDFAYLIISLDASLKPIFKSHNLLFNLASYLLLKYTVIPSVSGSVCKYMPSKNSILHGTLSSCMVSCHRVATAQAWQYN